MTRRFVGVLALVILIGVFLTRHPPTVDKPTGFFDRLVMKLALPFIQGSDWVRRGVQGSFRHYIFLVGMSRRHDGLAKEVGQLSTEVSTLEERVKELGRVETLMAAAVDVSETVVARVIAYDPLAAFQITTLDKGSREGMKVGMVALAQGGLAGQVIRVGHRSSHLLLITDPNSAVDGVMAASRARVIVRGGGKKFLEGRRPVPMTYGEYFKEGGEIAVGDVVFTSGLDGIYPKGLKIGRVVTSDEKNEQGLGRGLILPAADLAKLEEVRLLKPLEREP